MKTCRFCAEEIQDAAIVCKHCGRDLADPSLTPTSTKKKASPWGKLAGVVVGLFVVAWCANTLSPAKPKPGRVVTNETHEGMLRLPEDQLGRRLQRIVTGANENCFGVSRTFYQGMAPDGTAFWNLRCTGGQEYSIAVSADTAGTGKVLTCGALKAIARLECFKPLEGQ